MKKASIIIPIQVVSDHFTIFLDHLDFSLYAVSVQNTPCEKILVDYISHKKFVPMIKGCANKYGFKYVRAEHKDPLWSRSRSLNFGIDAATGNVYMMIDSDCVIPKNYVKQHLKAVNKNTVTFSPFYDTTEKIVKSGDYNKLFAQKNCIVGLRPSSYSHVAIPRPWLKKYGGYDNAYRGWGGEDDDLMVRFKRSKVVVKRIKTYPIHLWHPTWRELMKSAGMDKVQRDTLKENRNRFWTFKRTGKK